MGLLSDESKMLRLYSQIQKHTQLSHRCMSISSPSLSFLILSKFLVLINILLWVKFSKCCVGILFA